MQIMILESDNHTESLNADSDKFRIAFPTGVSIESASYMENNNLDETIIHYQLGKYEEDYTPKLFSEEQNFSKDEN